MSAGRFVRHNWYVAAWSSEVSGQQLLARRLLDVPVVLLRLQDGRVAALHDQCCHRGLPLSMGQHEGDGLRCGYHGMKYDGCGACVEIPGQPHIPAQARVRSWPVSEKHGLVWIWLGDAPPTEDAPDYPWHGDWAWRGGLFRYEADHELIVDNLLDLSHLGYVHQKTIGGDPASHMNAEMKTSRQGDRVRVERYMRGVRPPPTHVRLNGYTDPVDRWQWIESVPGLVTIYSGSVPAGTVRTEGLQQGGFQQRVFNAITPETGSSALYFWSVSHGAPDGPRDVIDKLYHDTELTFEEDRVVIERQYARMRENPGWRWVDLKIDSGALQGRRILQVRREAEAKAS
jgi:phenylpropionate dioxygenase-like ring-hydroxylating dioxygenase large terminal subunit